MVGDSYTISASVGCWIGMLEENHNAEIDSLKQFRQQHRSASLYIPWYMCRHECMYSYVHVRTHTILPLFYTTFFLLVSVHMNRHLPCTVRCRAHVELSLAIEVIEILGRVKRSYINGKPCLSLQNVPNTVMMCVFIYDLEFLTTTKHTISIWSQQTVCFSVIQSCNMNKLDCCVIYILFTRCSLSTGISRSVLAASTAILISPIVVVPSTY